MHGAYGIASTPLEVNDSKPAPENLEIRLVGTNYHYIITIIFLRLSLCQTSSLSVHWWTWTSLLIGFWPWTWHKLKSLKPTIHPSKWAETPKERLVFHPTNFQRQVVSFLRFSSIRPKKPSWQNYVQSCSISTSNFIGSMGVHRIHGNFKGSMGIS